MFAYVSEAASSALGPTWGEETLPKDFPSPDSNILSALSALEGGCFELGRFAFI